MYDLLGTPDRQHSMGQAACRITERMLEVEKWQLQRQEALSKDGGAGIKRQSTHDAELCLVALAVVNTSVETVAAK